MGNTVTKESGGIYADIERTRTDVRATDHPPIDRDAAANQCGSAAMQPSSRSRSSRHHHHHHHHHGSKQAKPKRESYEMIIDPNETVDGGYLFPQGVYHGGQDFKVSVVRSMIIKRRLAPFYKGLDSVEPDWTDDELLKYVQCSVPAKGPPGPDQPGPPTEKQQIWLYRNVHECPICFLVYPRLNETRCCAQSICTECFVQIKRNPPHPPYTTTASTEATDVLDLLSEPAACPYCAQPDLGVIFEAPPFEWGIPSGSDSSSAAASLTESASSSRSLTPPRAPAAGAGSAAARPRRPSLPASHPTVVTIDMIRPDWEEKLASARRRLARKSAAARALHRSALLPHGHSETAAASANADADAEDPTHPSSPWSSSPWSYPDASSLSDVIQASRSMSSAQTRALERRMIDEAIKASLAQQ